MEMEESRSAANSKTPTRRPYRAPARKGERIIATAYAYCTGFDLGGCAPDDERCCCVTFGNGPC
jgi:hypothetical protein